MKPTPQRLAELDAAFAKAEGFDPHIIAYGDAPKTPVCMLGLKPYQPHCDLNIVIPVMLRERFDVSYVGVETLGITLGRINEVAYIENFDDHATPTQALCVAIMRARIAQFEADKE